MGTLTIHSNGQSPAEIFGIQGLIAVCIAAGVDEAIASWRAGYIPVGEVMVKVVMLARNDQQTLFAVALAAGAIERELLIRAAEAALNA